MYGCRFVKLLIERKIVLDETYRQNSCYQILERALTPGPQEQPGAAILLVMGKKARIKRLRLAAEQVDAIGEAYIHALGQLMAGEHRVTLFSHPVATGNDASLALRHELVHRGINPEDVLRAVKRKHRTEVEA